MIPLHPQPAGRDAVRWFIPAGTLHCIGVVDHLPPSLAVLLRDGTLAAISVAPGSVYTRLGPGRQWTVEGARVRTALHAALADPTNWRGSPIACGPCSLATACSLNLSAGASAERRG